MADKDNPCPDCGAELQIAATLIRCPNCKVAWGRCNGRWVEDRSECDGENGTRT
jgi:DNA-directed RNA polymerase subunit RPC12/RpoP